MPTQIAAVSLTAAGVSATDGVLLVLIALIGGIGITAIGPGGVLVTIGLFALTDLSPAEVAGTAIVTHIGTGLVGTLAFVRSGQLRQPQTRRLAMVLSVAALICTPLGAMINAQISTAQFGVLLAIFVTGVGVTVIVRDVSRARPPDATAEPHHDTIKQATLGGGVAAISGLFGVGGPMIAVPALVLAGYPMLLSLAAAQGQSVIVATTGTASYLVQDAISWPLAILTGVPEMIGVWIGWRIAHEVPARPLKWLLAGTLIILGPVLLVTR